MNSTPRLASRSTARFEFGRRGLASIVFAILRPGDARAATVRGYALKLVLPWRSVTLPVKDIETVAVSARWRWCAVHVRSATTTVTVSGISPDEAQSLAEALEAARVRWWETALAASADTFRPVDARLAQLADPPGYTTRKAMAHLRRNAATAVGRFPAVWPASIARTTHVRTLERVRSFLNDPERIRTRANETYITNEFRRSRAFFDTVEAHPLTEEQRHAVVVDETCNLVIAAAGSGKTSVIVAKAGWLLRRGYRQASELLLLAFARDARTEMQQRIGHRLGDRAVSDITVQTFHQLGKSIIGNAEGKSPTLAKVAEDHKALFDLLKGIVSDLLTDPNLSAILLNWFQDKFAPYRSEHEFRSFGEYWDYIRRYEIRSLQGEKVKSFEECEVANFLYLNAVPYEYERAYEVETATADKQQYQPDFYLTEAGIYLEHFAVTASGDTPAFIDRDEYLSGMEWKRRLHDAHGTTLIETYSHEAAAGRLTENLAAKLKAHDIALSPIPSDEVFGVLERQGRIDPFTNLVATFLEHFKGAQLTFRELARRAATVADSRRAEAFVSVFETIYQRYEQSLSDRGQIDFHDMINKATDHIRAGRYCSPYGYILVDEFQDISPSRASLLKALLERTPGAQLFAVGDDWQAIFRLAGADIAIMREFKERFGDSERVDLATTFRCCDRIAAVATDFILKNPSQIPKKVQSVHQAKGPSVHIGLPSERRSLVREALNEIAADAGEYDGTSSVLFLGRYWHAEPRNLSDLKHQFAGLRLSYKTVHGSKGLEADYVVVLGLCAGRHGFPTEIADDPLLNLVLSASEEHPNAEERRLFYVALTRARRRVFLLADGGLPSPFVMELLDDAYDVTAIGSTLQGWVPCPTCVMGRLERRDNASDRSTFYGCSNWPYCKYTQSACLACGTGLPVAEEEHFRCPDCAQIIEGCPRCDGWLQPKTSRFGPFRACSNWRQCDYTQDDRRAGPENRSAAEPSAVRPGRGR